MNRTLAKRYAFCDFSSIAGFPNQVPSRDEWENSLPRFRGEEWEVPAEHLLDFHDYMHRLQVVHEDVQIRLLCFSLEGIAHDWYRSLPNASVSSLADFHVAFHVFCKDHFPANLLYPQCCHEFHSSTKDSDVHEEYAAEENILHYDQEIVDSHHDSHEDVTNMVSNSFIKDDCHDDQIVSFEIFKDDDQITPSENFEHVEHIGILVEDSFRSAKDEEDSLQFLDLHGLSNLQLEHMNHDPECVDFVAAYAMSSLQFSDVKTQGNSIKYGEEGEDLKGPDQQPTLYVSPAEIPQPTFNRETNELSQQQIKEVFYYDFEDPFADFLESMSSIDLKIFLPEEDYLYPQFKPFFCMIYLLLLFKSRSNMLPVNKFLTWLHWKHEFT
jgi:hypothetical protein